MDKQHHVEILRNMARQRQGQATRRRRVHAHHPAHAQRLPGACDGHVARKCPGTAAQGRYCLESRGAVGQPDAYARFPQVVCGLQQTTAIANDWPSYACPLAAPALGACDGRLGGSSNEHSEKAGVPCWGFGQLETRPASPASLPIMARAHR